MIAHGRGGARVAHGKHGEPAADKRPQPTLVGCFLGRCFVDAQDRLGGESAGEFVISRAQGIGRLVLQLHHPAGRTRLAQHLLQEQRHPRFRLPKAAHQQRDQRHQPRAGLTGGNTRRQLGTGRRAAAATAQPMPLVLRDDRLDLGQFPDLMPQRLGIAGPRVSRRTAGTGRA